MQISLSVFEASQLIAKQFKVNSDEIRIEVPTVQAAPVQVPISPEFPIHEAVKLVRRFDYRSSSQKIDAIKALREFAATKNIRIGLAEAKFFVESI